MFNVKVDFDHIDQLISNIFWTYFYDTIFFQILYITYHKFNMEDLMVSHFYLQSFSIYFSVIMF
jgi:hypothetical protein